MNPLDMLQHVAFLIKVSTAAIHGTHEGLLIRVHTQVSEELAQTAEEFAAGHTIVLRRKQSSWH